MYWILEGILDMVTFLLKYALNRVQYIVKHLWPIPTYYIETIIFIFKAMAGFIFVIPVLLILKRQQPSNRILKKLSQKSLLHCFITYGYFVTLILPLHMRDQAPKVRLTCSEDCIELAKLAALVSNGEVYEPILPYQVSLPFYSSFAPVFCVISMALSVIFFFSDAGVVEKGTNEDVKPEDKFFVCSCYQCQTLAAHATHSKNSGKCIRELTYYSTSLQNDVGKNNFTLYILLQVVLLLYGLLLGQPFQNMPSNFKKYLQGETVSNFYISYFVAKLMVYVSFDYAYLYCYIGLFLSCIFVFLPVLFLFKRAQMFATKYPIESINQSLFYLQECKKSEEERTGKFVQYLDKQVLYILKDATIEQYHDIDIQSVKDDIEKLEKTSLQYIPFNCRKLILNFNIKLWK